MTVYDFLAGDANVRPVASLERRLFRAGGRTLIGHFLSLFLRLISSFILTRIFSLNTFGLLAIITAISAIIGLLTDLGLRQLIIRSPNGDKPSFFKTAWTVQVLRGLVVWVIVAGALHLAIFELLPPDSVYAQPRLPGLIVVASFSSGFQSMTFITASRDLNLQRVTLIGLVSQLFTLVAIILLGLLTRSIWAYVAGLILAAALTVSLRPARATAVVAARMLLASQARTWTFYLPDRELSWNLK